MSAIEVFVGHSSADKALAEALEDTLMRALALPPEKLRCTAVPSGAFAPGTAFAEDMLQEAAECTDFLALLTPESLESRYCLLELGARWGSGKDITALVVGNVDLSQLPLPQDGICRLQDLASVLDLISGLRAKRGLPSDTSPYFHSVEKLNALADGYERPIPTPLMFDRTHNPRRLDADTLTRTAEDFLDHRMTPSDDFFPGVVVGINSGGNFAASVFCERHPLIRMGAVWTIRAGSRRVVDPARSFLPSVTGGRPKVLLVDSKLGTGHSVVAITRWAREFYGEEADVRLLASLVYGGWGKDRRDLEFPNAPAWPAHLRIAINGQTTTLRFYAHFYTTRCKDQDDVEEPGRPPRTLLA